MKASPYTVGILMIFMAGIGISGMEAHVRPSPAGYAVAGVLLVSGALLFLRRPFGFYVALGAAALLAATGLLALLGRPELALPLPPVVTIVIGLYLCLRAVIARPAMSPPRKKIETAGPPDDGGAGAQRPS